MNTKLQPSDLIILILLLLASSLLVSKCEAATVMADPATGVWQSPSAALMKSGNGLGLVANPLSQFAATTSAQLFGVISDETGGSGVLVGSISPSLTTPNIGAATATSINGLTLTASTGTFTLTNGKVFTVSNTLTLAGTDSSTLNIGTGGTLGTAAFVATGTSGATIPLLNGNNTYSGTALFSGSSFSVRTTENALRLGSDIGANTITTSTRHIGGIATARYASDTQLVEWLNYDSTAADNAGVVTLGGTGYAAQTVKINAAATAAGTSPTTAITATSSLVTVATNLTASADLTVGGDLYGDNSFIGAGGDANFIGVDAGAGDYTGGGNLDIDGGITADGSNSTLPNQAASSDSSIMTRKLVDSLQVCLSGRQAFLKTNAALSVSGVDTGADTLTITAHGIGNNTGVTIASSGTVPGGLSAATTYYARSVDANTVSLHSTLDGSVNNTGKVDITSAGSGTITANGSAYTQCDFKTIDPATSALSTYYSTTTRRFTATETMRVIVSMTMQLGAADTDGLTIRVWKNGIETGTLSGISFERASGNTDVYISLTPVVIDLVSTDYIEFSAGMTGATNVRNAGINSGSTSNASNCRAVIQRIQ